MSSSRCRARSTISPTPRYRGRLVVENPATSSPGLAFLLATVARYGTDGWLRYWERLRANDVKVVDGWEQAYDSEFSAGSGHGGEPLVVSYASSPPAEVYYADPKPTSAPTGALTDTCFRQVELAGVLQGADHPEAARQLIDFMLSERFQSDIPLQMFVFPARAGTPLPSVFTKFATVPSQPFTLSPKAIGSTTRRLDQAVDHHRAAVTRLGRVALVAIPVTFLAIFFAWPVIEIIGRGLAPDGTLDLAPLGEVLTDPALRHVFWFTVWQAVLSTALTLVLAMPGAFVLSRYRFRGRAVARALVDRPVRPADDRGRRRVPGPRCLRLGRGDPARARVLQLRGRGANRRWAVVSPRPAPGGGRAGPRREPVADVRQRHAPGAPPRDHRGRVDRVPVLLHLVRGDPRTRRPALRHPRDRDLPPDRAAARPPGCRRPRRGPARGRARRARGRRVGTRAADGSPRPAGGERGEHQTPDDRRPRVPRRQPGLHARVPRHPDRGARVPVVRARPQPRRIPRPHPREQRLPRAADPRGVDLSAIRDDRHRDRPRHRRRRRVRSGGRRTVVVAAGEGCWTCSSCSLSASRR